MWHLISEMCVPLLSTEQDSNDQVPFVQGAVTNQSMNSQNQRIGKYALSNRKGVHLGSLEVGSEGPQVSQ